MSKKVVTLGEIMLRLSTPDFKRFVQADTFDITYGGGEANVAAALCNYGLNGTFVSKVPNNAIGQSAINHLRRYGVDTQFVARGGDRLGIYFLETGASMRASLLSRFWVLAIDLLPRGRVDRQSVPAPPTAILHRRRVQCASVFPRRRGRPRPDLDGLSSAAAWISLPSPTP